MFGEIGALKGPPLPLIERGTSLLPTHSEIHEILVPRAEDPEGFMDAQIAAL